MEWAQLAVDAAEAVAWPLVVVFLFWRFAPEIRQQLRRLKSGSLPGGLSFELFQQVTQQEQQMEAVAASVAEMEAGAPAGEAEDAPNFNAIERGIVDTLAVSPIAALLRLRHEVREVLRGEAEARGFPAAAKVNTREMVKRFATDDDPAVRNLAGIIDAVETFNDQIVNMAMQRPDDANVLATAHVNGALLLPALAYSTLHGRDRMGAGAREAAAQEVPGDHVDVAPRWTVKRRSLVADLEAPADHAAGDADLRPKTEEGEG